MAMKPAWLPHLFWILLAAFGIDFFLLLLVLGLSTATGMIPRAAWNQALQVIEGTHVALPEQDYEELERLREQEEERQEKLRRETGEGEIYGYAREREEATAKMRREEARLMLERLEIERKKLEDLRETVEAEKAQAEAARVALEQEREKAAVVEAAQPTERLKKTFASMDADDLAADLATMAAGSQANLEYAVSLLRLMKPMQVSEVLTEMPADVRQEIWPLLHNQYADMSPDKVVAEWRRRDLTPGQMKEFLRSMPPTQVVAVLRRLDRSTRQEVEELLAPLPAMAEGGR